MQRNAQHILPVSVRTFARGTDWQAQSCLVIEASYPDDDRPEYCKLIVLHHN